MDFSPNVNRTQFSENVSTSAVFSDFEQARFAGWRYIVVDIKQGKIKFVTDKKLGSSLRQIHRFAMKYFDKLDREIAKLLLSEVTLRRRDIHEEASKHGLLYNFFSAILTFIGNLGKTDKTLIREIKAKLTSVKVAKTTRIKVEIEDSPQVFDVPTEESDRAESGKKKEYYRRSSEEKSVKKHVEKHFIGRREVIPDASTLVSGVTFERLRGNNQVDYQQFEDAARNKLADLATGPKHKIFPHRAHEGAAFIAGELGNLIQDLPDERIRHLEDLKADLINRVKTNNEKKEIIDRETFQDLITRKTKVPISLFNSPEYRVAKRAFSDGTWKKNEEKVFHTREIEDLNPFLRVIDSFFEDPDVIAAMQQFLPKTFE